MYQALFICSKPFPPGVLSSGAQEGRVRKDGRRRQTQGIAAELESPGQDGQGGKEEGDVKRFSLGDRQKNKAPRGWR